MRVFPLLILIANFVTAEALAVRPRGEAPTDASTYEAVTGESIDDDRVLWDTFYKSKSNAFGKEAVSFLKDELHGVKKGRAFVPAMGEGRNAIYLAKHGFTVEGNDSSETSVSRALDEAKSQHVTLKAEVADLKEFNYPENYYDLVLVSLFYIKDLMPKLKNAVKHGGYILFYEKLDASKQGLPAGANEFGVKTSELKTALKDFEIKVSKEYKDHDVDVVGILARRP